MKNRLLSAVCLLLVTFASYAQHVIEITLNAENLYKSVNCIVDIAVQGQDIAFYQNKNVFVSNNQPTTLQIPLPKDFKGSETLDVTVIYNKNTRTKHKNPSLEDFKLTKALHILL